jgi:hypothetical protein
MVNAETQGAEPDDDEDAAAATADVKDRTEASHRSGKRTSCLEPEHYFGTSVGFLAEIAEDLNVLVN